MRNIYTYFVDYYKSILGDSPYSLLVEQGIKDYLESIALWDVSMEEQESEKIAKREMARFKLMSLGAFSAFFETYLQRERILEIRNECKILAFQRATTGVTIDSNCYRQKFSCFYKESENLPTDKRYTGWIDDISKDISVLLRYAIGDTNYIPEEVAMLMQYSDETEE